MCGHFPTVSHGLKTAACAFFFQTLSELLVEYKFLTQYFLLEGLYAVNGK